MVLSDRDIKTYVIRHDMIEPFVDHNVKEPGMLSYGLQSGGYDLRLGTRFKFLRSENLDYLEPWNINPAHYEDKEFGIVCLHAGQSMLAETVEWLRMPLDVSGQIIGKSSMARCFITLNTTVIEPGWHGRPTLEITNMGSTTVALRSGMGIAQIQFHLLSSRCEVGYAEKGGIYQFQSGVQESGWREDQGIRR